MRLLPLLALLAAVSSVGCAHRGLAFPGPTRHMGWEPPSYASTLEEPHSNAVVERHAPPPTGSGGGAAVARGAVRLIGRSHLLVNGERYRWDCSGMVIAAHASAGHALAGSSADLYELARERGVLHRKKRPYVGDVAFFDDTYDRNGNGRRDDELTHVGVVESVDSAGTITVVHLGSQGVVRIVMNLRRLHDHEDESGTTINSYLRAAHDADGGPVLSGELWRGFGSLWAIDDRAVAEGRPAEDPALDEGGDGA